MAGKGVKLLSNKLHLTDERNSDSDPISSRRYCSRAESPIAAIAENGSASPKLERKRVKWKGGWAVFVVRTDDALPLLLLLL